MSESDEEYDSPTTPGGGEEGEQRLQGDELNENKASDNESSDESESDESEGEPQQHMADSPVPPGPGGEEHGKQSPTEEEDAETAMESAQSPETGEGETKISDPFGDEDSDGGEGDEGMASAVASASAQASRFMRESDSEEEERKDEDQPAETMEGEEKKHTEARR